MNPKQQTAARRVLNRYPALNVSILREGSLTKLTPYKEEHRAQQGATVEILTDATPPEAVERVFETSCRDLMAS